MNIPSGNVRCEKNMQKNNVNERKFNCYIIGNDNLLISCCDILLSRGHTLLGVISPSLTVQKWARNNNITHVASLAELQSAIVKQCDYLFSIVNNEILPEWALALPKHAAINYHDALLPKFAGVHSTSWAIMKGEKWHGVSWHIMTSQLDAGDVLKQAAVEISEDETALSLNLKCYELAIETFSALVDELAQGSYRPISQDLMQRSYYGAQLKPFANGLIQWNESADNIDKLCRALNFGHTTNRLASLKFSFSDNILIVGEGHKTDSPSTELPGTVVNIAATGLEVATKTHNFVITKILSMDNIEISMQELRNKYGVKSSSRLKSLDEVEQQKIKMECEQYAKYESYWVKKLCIFNAAQFPFLPPLKLNQLSSKYSQAMQFTLSDNLVEFLTTLQDKTYQIEEILLTSWLIYLYRLGNQENSDVGYMLPIVTNTLMAKQVPFIVKFSDDMDFISCIKKVRDAIKELQPNKSYLRDVHYRYPELRNCARFFPIVIVMAYDMQNFNFEGFNAMVVAILPSGRNIQVFLNQSVINDNLLIVLKSASEHFQSILHAILIQPDKIISELDLLPEKERKKIVEEWNQTATNFPCDKTVHQLFEEQAEKTPNHIAAFYADEEISYAELNQKSNRLAHYLRKLGVGAETPVAICIERGLTMIVALLGVLKAGGAYVPIDPGYPEARIQYMLDDCQTRVFLTEQSVFDRVKKMMKPSISMVTLDGDGPRINNEPSHNLDDLARPDSLMYIIYTSGSTGKPKGVLIEHRGVVRLVKSSNYLEITENDNIAQIAEVSFDASAFEIWGALTNGAKLTIIPNTIKIDIKKLIATFQQHKISISLLITSLFSRIIQENICYFPTVRVLLVGGEKLSARLLKDFFNSKCKNKPQLLNCYGPTEVATIATFYKILETDRHKDLIPIGKPISNTQTYVLDSNCKILPIGAQGNLYLGGPGVARGYLNQPELTKKYFIPDFIDKHVKSCLYNTGDRVRWLPDGNLEYLGRQDSQVKIRGYRIDLGEIEAVLLKNSLVSDAAVVLNENKSLLVVYVVRKKPMDDSATLESNLRKFLANTLPEYMLPQTFVEVEQIPYFSNGKIDKKSLVHTYKNLSKDFKAIIPSNEIERLLVKIWKEIFKLDHVSVIDNFFSLGGDSILAMQSVAKSRRHGISLKVKEIFLHPSISELAAIVQKNKLFASVGEDATGEIPLLPIQHWFFEQNFSVKEQWSQVCLLDLMGNADTEILRRCLQILPTWHDALRARFFQEKSGWKQHYTDNASIEFQIVNLPATSELEDVDKQILEWELKIQEYFDLTDGPLFGAVVIAINNVPKKLLMAAHHLIIDGVSWRILLEDMQLLYRSLSEGKVPELGIKTSSYKSWAIGLEQYVKSNSWREKKEALFFANQAVSLPRDFQSNSNLEKDAKTRTAELTDIETHKLLKEVLDNKSSHINDILLAVLAKTFEAWTGKNSFLLDMEGHGRDVLENDLEVSHTVGWFTNLYPLFLDWPEKASLDVLLDLIKEKTMDVRHIEINYGALRYLCVKTKSALEKCPPAEMSFNYWGQFKGRVGERDIFRINRVYLASNPCNARPYLIDINGWVKNEKLYISFTYNKKHYKNETIQCILENYMEILRKFLALERYKSDISYPLTSLQKGMLFHALDSTQSAAYFVHLHWQFDGELNVPFFCQAWQRLVDRHDSLRTSLHWDGLDEPLQVVNSTAELSWRHYDWTDSRKEELNERLQEFLNVDRQAGFDFMCAPLMRLAIIKLSENAYYIVLSMHHLIIDGWCIPVLLRELSMIYQALTVNENPELKPALPYYHYMRWLQQQDNKGAEGFWRQYLSGFYAPTDLVIVGKKPPIANSFLAYQTYQMADVFLSEKFTLQIKQFAKYHEVTLNTIFQLLWSIVLARYNQVDDILFGVTLSTRSPELIHSEEMVGLFINTVPFRVKFNHSATVKTCLNALQKNFTGLIEHRYTPLTDIKRWSEIPSGTNLFQSVMVFENYPVNEPGKYLFDSSNVKIDDPSHYPLVFYVAPGERLSLKINYDSSLISEKSIDKLIGHLKILLREIIHCPDKPIFQLSLLNSSEYQQMLDDSSAKEPAVFPENLAHQIFEQKAAENPAATALIFEDKKMIYQELNEKANQLAHYLRREGVGAETIVSICVERGFETLIGILGILKSGGAYLPIDPVYPDARIEFSLIDSGAKIFILQNHLYERLKGSIPCDVKIILIDSDWHKITCETKQNPVNITALENLMYIIYTSGSTGKPKGVMLEQRNLLHLFAGARHKFDFHNNDVWTLFHSFSFDFSVWEIWGALLYGGSLVIVPGTATHMADEFYRLLIKHKVTILSQTPSAFYQLAIIAVSYKQKLFLRFIVFDGEVLAPKIIQLWSASYAQRETKLINMYGITETTVHLTYCEIMPAKLIDGLRYPIGKGLPGVGLYILDKNLQPVPRGMLGELYVSGNFLARGYLDQELTSKRFINMSLDGKKVLRLYRTGDLVRRLDGGDLDYFGRLDNQIKLRGFRIELDEISTWVEKYPGITHAITKMVKIGETNECLATYVLTEDKKRIEAQALKDYLSAYLPDYMIPAVFIFLRDFPLGSNGKVDMRALPPPNLALANANNFVPPRTPEEKIVADIWKNVLQLDTIGIHDNFFTLGGHSLLALQVLLQIKQHFKTELPVRAVLDAATVAELASYITEDQDAQHNTALYSAKPQRSCLVLLQPQGNKTPLFLVHPVGGTVFWYVPLAKYLDSTRPLYGIQDPGVENLDQIPLTTIEEMASFYLAAIQSVQPHGPYLLGGASGGAIISFEMARQLLAKGERVEFLGLLDGWVPHPIQLKHEEVFEAMMRRQYNTMREKYVAKGIDRAEKLLRLQWQRVQMLDKYRIGSVSIKLTLFKAHEVTPIYQAYESPLNHWESCSACPVELHRVPGDHETMFQEPNAKVLAKKIMDCLNRSEELKHYRKKITLVGKCKNL